MLFNCSTFSSKIFSANESVHRRSILLSYWRRFLIEGFFIIALCIIKEVAMAEWVIAIHLWNGNSCICTFMRFSFERWIRFLSLLIYHFCQRGELIFKRFNSLLGLIKSLAKHFIFMTKFIIVASFLAAKFRSYNFFDQDWMARISKSLNLVDCSGEFLDFCFIK